MMPGVLLLQTVRLAGSGWLAWATTKSLLRPPCTTSKKPAVREYEQLSFPSEANPFREIHGGSHERRRGIRQSAGSALRRVPCSVLFAELRAMQPSAVGNIDRCRYGGRQNSLASAARLDAELRRCSHYTASARLAQLGRANRHSRRSSLIAGTFDPVIRAFDVETGKELWKAQLP